jgi:DNA-binding MarR family transcriptional regulator
MRRAGGAGRREPAIAAQAEEIVALVRALRRELLHSPAEDAEREGLTGPQLSVMACLVGKGPTTLTEVSRALGMSHSTASGIVDRLQARGLVRRTEDSEDQRRTRIVVTDKVARYVQDLQAGPAGRVAARRRSREGHPGRAQGDPPGAPASLGPARLIGQPRRAHAVQDPALARPSKRASACSASRRGSIRR